MDILAEIFDVFNSTTAWFSGAVTDIMPIFYTAEAGLTIIGVLTVAGLAMSVVFLLLGVISNFVRFRG